MRALVDDFAIIGVANTSQASAEPTAKACDRSRAFASPEVDVVVVTVKVPRHSAIVREAIAAGKHVCCEWPLGNGLDEALELA